MKVKLGRAVTGLLVFLSFFGIFGRASYALDAADTAKGLFQWFAQTVLPANVYVMPSSVRLNRPMDRDYFQKLDKDYLTWEAEENQIFTIDEGTGSITFRPMATSYLYKDPVKVTVYDDRLFGVKIKVRSVDVTVGYAWWEWIIVVLLFGWIYL